MQSQKRPSGMFDQYLQDDSSSGQYQRYEDGEPDDEELTDEAEPMEAEDAPEKDAPMPHAAMMKDIMQLLRAMTGMLTALLKEQKHAKAEDDSAD